ncbi:unnamed protein product [Nezara viridula]|uniref:Uncharacterized protein n=1 Tax=Nezara viridula TaxID=85310 RepID=A0A9P0HQC1_NEZVI|nr:unnamed protein product [Nezara viridula]
MNKSADYSQDKQLFKLNVCRLCSLIRDKLLPIFDNSGSKVDLKIKQCFPELEIKKGDFKPQHICLDCITKLNMFNEFLQVCVGSQYKFNSYLKEFEDEENLLKSSFLNNTNASLMDEASKIQKKSALQNNEGVIVLSKLDPVLCDASVRDFVVKVELKYKENKTGSEMKNDDVDSMQKKSALHFDSQDKSCSSSSSYSISSQLKDNQQNKGTSSNKYYKDKKIFQCTVCGHSFSRQTRLKSHMSRHTSIKPFKCDKCDKAYALRWDLNAHKRIHSLTFVCNTCNKSFSSKSKLGRHNIVHTGERPYPCPQCGKSFAEKSNLTNHIRGHTGDKPFSCTICGKSFSVRSHLKDHLSVHNKTPRFSCTLCSKSFKWKTNYNRHFKSHNTAKHLSS